MAYQALSRPSPCSLTPGGGPYRQEVPGRGGCPQAPCAGDRVSRQRSGPTSSRREKNTRLRSVPVFRHVFRSMSAYIHIKALRSVAINH